MLIAASREVLGAGGAFADAVPGWEVREEQLDVAAAVARAIDDDAPLLVEAGTGTGKTLAYLVPAVLSGRRVIVSTGTRHLQEQLHGRDVPLLAQALGRPVDAALLKGISNYVCVRKLGLIGDTRDPALVRITDWARTTITGDRAELADVPDDSPAWREVTTTPDARLGPRCPAIDRCLVAAARRRAAEAQLVIVNHHLYFADLALRAQSPGARILPEHDVVIFDEAHQVEDVATEHFGVAVSSLRLLALQRDAARTLGLAADHAIQTIEHRADDLFAAIRARLVAAGGFAERAETPPDLFEAGAARSAWLGLDAALEALAAHAERVGGEGGSAGFARRGAGGPLVEDEEAEHLAHRAQGVRNDLATLAEPDRAGKHVHWAEVRGRTVHLAASPVDVGPLIRGALMDQGKTVIFCSATLSTGGTFDYTRARLGLGEELAVPPSELAVGSPFDWSKQAILYLPRDLPAPSEPTFGAAFLDRVVELTTLTEGRAFVLFTSHRALRAAAEVLPKRVPWPVLVQGDASPPQLLARFRSTPNAILLATAGFWEGVDVPGEQLSLVIVEKLPFAPPDDPLTAARVRAEEARERDPFATYQVPRAALALRQGFGRLIRRRDDRGIVAILDHRVVTKNYGQTFLRTLPPVPRTSVLEQVRRWWVNAPEAAAC